jgi:hypothetical protein
VGHVSREMGASETLRALPVLSPPRVSPFCHRISPCAPCVCLQEVEAYLVGQAPLIATMYNAAAVLASECGGANRRRPTAQLVL